MAIHFAQTEIKFNLKGKQVLKTWIKKVIEKEKLKLGEIAYTFCSDNELLKINQDFLKHDTYTDIITFDYRENNIINGEIYISVDRIKENAEKFKTTFEQELHRVMIHGILHICGYKDKTKLDKEEMRKKEDSSLKLLSKI